MKYLILLTILISSCAQTETCIKWEPWPATVDCIEWGYHPLGDQDRLVCMGRGLCRKCVETKLSYFNLRIPPVNACKDPMD